MLPHLRFGLLHGVFAVMKDAGAMQNDH